MISIIIILMIIAAIIALESKDMLSSVVSIGAVGILLTLNFILLHAPDLAIVQFVVEILSLVILIRATVVRDESSHKGKQFLIKIPAILFLIIFFIFSSYYILNNIVDSDSSIQLKSHGTTKISKENKLAKYYINNALKDTAATNVVSAIILNYRAYDTLGETIVLLTAILAATTILRKHGKKKQ